MDQYPSYKKGAQPQRGDPVGPSRQELLKRARANFDPRFNSPFGFQEQKFKRNFIQRYPRLFIAIFTTTCLSLFFSKPIYDICFREHTEAEIRRGLYLKKRMQETGFWDSPFNMKKDN